MRHIVLEGPDGGGKTHLAEAFMSVFPELIRAEKASDSMTGPIKNLAAWVKNQFQVMDLSPAPRLYDRHPVISEPIYGSIVRDVPKPGFSPSPWLSTSRLGLAQRTFMVWCIPSLEQCRKAVTDDRDMPGVRENIDRLYSAYLDAMSKWPGIGIRYNLSLSEGVIFDGLFTNAKEFVTDHAPIIRDAINV